jgi:hypothetical protein
MLVEQDRDSWLCGKGVKGRGKVHDKELKQQIISQRRQRGSPTIVSQS